MERACSGRTTGLIIGKFMPPHKGHRYMVDFASRFVDKLIVLVYSLKNEPIPGELRYKWMKEMFPNVTVKHVTDKNPPEPKGHPDFWKIWHDSILRAVPEGADYLFASEEYGSKLAEVLNAKYIPVDPDRQIVPTSGTAIRNNPMLHWDYLPEIVRPYFVKKICVFGPESTGKSILAKKLAEHFNTVHIGEYGRTFLNTKDGKCVYEDIELIARGQIASEDAAAKLANRIIICDTDLLTTQIWSEILFGKCPDWISKQADKRKYDLYLLMDTDVPFVPDNQRYGDGKRQLSVERCKKELESRGKHYVVISGNWEERFQKSVAAIKEILGGGLK